MTTPRVAFFCMEYGLHEDLPIYAGGLGVLAGDYAKTVADRRLPVTCIGIFWSEGYALQEIGDDGRPRHVFPKVSRDALRPTGAMVTVTIRGRDVPLEAYRVDGYGAGELLLLEPVNERDRALTRHLYGGGDTDRVAQEIILGVGGVRLLRELQRDVDVYHFNEGHAVFAGIELLREETAAGKSFDEALREVRRRVVFTTHTPVPAGNEVHSLELLAEQGASLGFSREELVALGGDPFGMTVAGLRLSRVANGVAELHGETARTMWRHVQGGAPITAITNGVHRATWQAEAIRCAQSDEDLWSAHQAQKGLLLGALEKEAEVSFDPDRLLIGFARRAAAYKRADLLFRKLEVLEPLLAERRIQLIFGGKAHPADDSGKGIVAKLVEMARRYAGAVVFLPNYDMRWGRLLTRGCDVWLNNPRRPLEASGTSGMKAAMNGVLNMSILDGWWPEGCRHGETGWQFGDGYQGPDQDERDLAALYKVLLDEVVPTYYDARPRWIQMMRASIEMSSWRFSAARMVEDYYNRLYRTS